MAASWLRFTHALLTLLLIPSLSASERTIEFNRDIRPILSDQCFHCHGPDKNTRKGKLRLDVREEAIARKAVIPNQPDRSLLVIRIRTNDVESVMPPADSHKTLTENQKALLERWIAEGAEYQMHWSHIPPRRGLIPSSQLASWPRNAIDAYILKGLEDHQLKPSPEADRRTLIRRLSLDLLGIPPTPSEVDYFVRDPDERAYEHLVERILASPHFGERMAASWLDVVRYADTVGYHGDQNVPVFPYRDYVVASFNQNKPFDQFTTEQLAGDLLPKPSIEQRIATGFNRLNMMTREGGAQPREYLAKYAADRVRTVATAWLGSTMGCAECHDHKFDPFTMRDFYSMSAYFADIKQWGVYQDYGYTPNPDLRGWSNDHPFPPELEVENNYLKDRAQRLKAAMRNLLEGQELNTLMAGSNPSNPFDWSRAMQEFLNESPSGWLVPEWRIASAQTNAFLNAQRELVLTGPRKEEDIILEAELPISRTCAIRVELLPESTNSIARNGPALNLALSARIFHTADSTEQSIPFHFADSTLKSPRYFNGYELHGILGGWRTVASLSRTPHVGVWTFKNPGVLRSGDRLRVVLRSEALSRVRISISPLMDVDPLQEVASVYRELADLPHRNLAMLRDDQRLVLLGSWIMSSEVAPALRARYQALHLDWVSCRNGKTPTLVTEAWQPMVTRVLHRGNWQDETGEIVQPSPPEFLISSKATAATRTSAAKQAADPKSAARQTRLDLARWLMSDQNPLTARTLVNRWWKQLFGTGLSSQADDLGAQGEWPTHPELLDWLAVEFRESGWNTKHLFRLMVQSATYRQLSNLRAELRDLDPGNRLLASQNPRRLEAEAVRDNALSISGLLVRDIGGPSVHPYQPPGYYSNLQFPDRDYQADADDRQYRRGLYTHWQRTFLHPMLANFDAPSREECTANRSVSNTPQQALTLLNDPTFVEAARAFADRLLGMPDLTDEQRLAAAFERALARTPKRSEVESLIRFLDTQRRYFQDNPDEIAKLARNGRYQPMSGSRDLELAAWTSFCRVLLNTHEVITRY